MRVLVTGASGVIGRHVLQPLAAAGHEVWAVSRSGGKSGGGVRWLRADLFDSDAVAAIFSNVRPEGLIHFAWDTRPGKYLHDNLNFRWLSVSLDILECFRRHGGVRALLAGTCLEYAYADHLLKEAGDIAPVSVYARCKNHLNRLGSLFCSQNKISYAWGRIFYVYGPGEQAGRLTPDLLSALKRGEPFTVRGGALRRDYMHAADIAAGFAALFDSCIEGEVNVCSGEAVLIEKYCRLLAAKTGREELLVFNDESGAQPRCIAGDVSRLRKEVGFSPRYSLEQGIDALLRNRG